MNVTNLKQRLCDRLDESNVDPTFYTPEEMVSALNKAQNLFALLTLSIERTADFALTIGQCFYTNLRTSFTDYLVPLRVILNNARILPATLHELDALSATWFSTSGTPTKYFAKGLNLLAVYRQPTGSATLAITYAASPTQLFEDSDTPEIEATFHDSLVDFATYYLRPKEGGQELQNSLQYLDRFLTETGKKADFVRARSRAQQYDTESFDLASFDRSRLIKIQLQKRQTNVR